MFTLVPQMVKYPWVGVGKQQQPVGTACLFMAGDQKQIMIGAGGYVDFSLHLKLSIKKEFNDRARKSFS